MDFKRFYRLLLGLILYAIGIVTTYKANLGLAPWDALHVGLSGMLGMTFGQFSIVLGVFILIINYNLRESIGVGTIISVGVIGVMIDLLMVTTVIPTATSLISGLTMLLVGMVTIAVASYFYIGAAYGAGPRDGLIIALARSTGWSVGMIFATVDGCAVVIGYLTDAPIGIGTVILVCCMGPIIEYVFRLLRFEPKKVVHDGFLQKKEHPVVQGGL